MNKGISILFPSTGEKPIGGYKIILQYANKFAEIGYDVNVVYSTYYDIPVKWWHKILRIVKLYIRHIIILLSNNYSCKQWFSLKDSIHEFYVWSLYTSKIPKADFYFATAAVTAKSLLRFNVPTTNKYYFIQGYEPWQIGDTGLIETYKIPCKKIVVSKWLKSYVDKYSDPTYIVSNGFSQDEFNLSKPQNERSPHIVSILFHTFERKGFRVGLEALKLVKIKIPKLKVLAFGVYERPEYLPDWFDYFQKPDTELHNWINNEASIYLGTSFVEGYGLTIGEAMMCGQAVVCTNNDGYLEMAVPGVNALVCPVGDTDALANAVIRLIEDNNLRLALAQKGYRTIQDFTIEKSFTKLLRIMQHSEHFFS